MREIPREPELMRNNGNAEGNARLTSVNCNHEMVCAKEFGKKYRFFYTVCGRGLHRRLNGCIS